jgi:hypothetical protein
MRSSELGDDVILFAKKVARHHVINFMDVIFEEIKSNKELSEDYDRITKKRIGKKAIPRFRDLEEIREEIRMAMLYVFMMSGISREWPGGDKKR